MLSRVKSVVFSIVGRAAIRRKKMFGFISKFVKRMNVYNIKPLYDFANKKNGIIKRISDSMQFDYLKAASMPQSYEEERNYEIEKRSCSRQYVSLLHEVIVRGDTDGIISQDDYLSDKVLFDKKGMYEHAPSRSLIDDNRIFIYTAPKENIRQVENAVTLVKMWSYNYFHFVMEGLSRLGSVEDLAEYQKWPLIIDECVKIDFRNVELINLLNVHKREIVWIKKSETIKVRNLIVPACMSWAIWDVKASIQNGWGYMISIYAGLYLRNTVLANYTPKRVYNCVYVARGNCKRLVNETEVIDYFLRAGFEIFYPDKVSSFQEEIDCFSTAKCIVLCSGGASTNLIWCNPDVTIYGILPFRFRCDNPLDITQTVGIDVRLRDATVIEDNGMLMTSKFSFSIEKCAEIVEYCKEQGYINN